MAGRVGAGAGTRWRCAGCSGALPAVRRRPEAPAARGPEPARAIELDGETAVALLGGVLGAVVGIGAPIFYASTNQRADERPNEQPCFNCQGTGQVICRFCDGAGAVTIDLGMGNFEKTDCISCSNVGYINCATCAGKGIQPRYLDRRVFEDND